MSTPFTKDNLDDIVIESIADTLDFNNQQAVLTVRGGAGQLDQTYFERYSNNKDKILKSAGVTESSIPKSINVENLLIAKQIADLVNLDSGLKEIKRHFSNGHVKIDTSSTVTTLKLANEDMIKNAASEVLLRVSAIQHEPIGKGYSVTIPAVHGGAVSARNLVDGLKIAGEYVTESLSAVKNKVDLKQNEKPTAKTKLKM
ncbi:hypothetical protein [Pseudomonas sp. ATCC PTA-122608]|uniref:hypothetical protein n=1 Tax=Pseudomonas sp. ATCC PTA-122608 TaxID=1771311 RepID=UPI00117B061D|nr:hypothetical protein [Pseudomonas sp. ATCC PTA-122608]